MYLLIASRYEGLREIEIQLCRKTSYKVCKDIQRQYYNGGAFEDKYGNTWYTEIIDEVDYETANM